MTHRDPAYQQEERIVFGLPGLLVLIGFLLAMVLFSTGCAESGPIRRVLDTEVGVMCYYTRSAMSCIHVQVKKGGHKTDTASYSTSAPEVKRGDGK